MKEVIPKYLIISPLIFISVISCSNHEIDEEKQPINIQVENEYNFIDNKSFTKTENLSTKDFVSMGVYAYYHSEFQSFDENSSLPNFMENQKVMRANNASSWSYTPRQYWPNAGTISFFAYAPFSSSVVTDNIQITKNQLHGYPEFDFTMSDEVSQLTDFLVAEPQKNKTIASFEKLTFYHKLALINFYAKIESPILDSETISIESIKIGDFISNATFKYPDWNLNSDKQCKSYLLSSSDHTLAEINLTSDLQQISSEENVLIVIPQEIDSQDLIEIKIKYNIDNQIFFRTVQKALKDYFTVWKMGYSYKLNLSVTPMGSLDISVNVADWNNYAINIPELD